MSFKRASAVLLASVLAAACSETSDVIAKQGRWQIEAATEASSMGYCKLNGVIDFDNLDALNEIHYERNVDGYHTGATIKVRGHDATNRRWEDVDGADADLGSMAPVAGGTDFEWGVWTCAVEPTRSLTGNWVMRKLPESTGILD